MTLSPQDDAKRLDTHPLAQLTSTQAQAMYGNDFVDAQD